MNRRLEFGRRWAVVLALAGLLLTLGPGPAGADALPKGIRALKRCCVIEGLDRFRGWSLMAVVAGPGEDGTTRFIVRPKTCLDFTYKTSYLMIYAVPTNRVGKGGAAVVNPVAEPGLLPAKTRIYTWPGVVDSGSTLVGHRLYYRWVGLDRGRPILKLIKCVAEHERFWGLWTWEETPPAEACRRPPGLEPSGLIKD